MLDPSTPLARDGLLAQNFFARRTVSYGSVTAFAFREYILAWRFSKRPSRGREVSPTRASQGSGEICAAHYRRGGGSGLLTCSNRRENDALQHAEWGPTVWRSLLPMGGRRARDYPGRTSRNDREEVGRSSCRDPARAGAIVMSDGRENGPAGLASLTRARTHVAPCRPGPRRRRRRPRVPGAA